MSHPSLLARSSTSEPRYPSSRDLAKEICPRRKMKYQLTLLPHALPGPAQPITPCHSLSYPPLYQEERETSQSSKSHLLMVLVTNHWLCNVHGEGTNKYFSQVFVLCLSVRSPILSYVCSLVSSLVREVCNKKIVPFSRVLTLRPPTPPGLVE